MTAREADTSTREGQGAGGQVYVSEWPKRLLTSSLVPRFLLGAVARGAVALLRGRIRRRDRLEAATAPPPVEGGSPEIWFADIYHGGVTFWDWVILRDGGLWWEVLWPLVIRTSVERLRLYPELRTVLDLDAHTYEELEKHGSSDVEALRAAVATARMEIVDGTYGQPLAPTIGGEANIRHFYYGLDVIERVLGAHVTSFVAGEPQFFPQLPQVLSGCGIENVVFRTHWAPFGTDPAADEDIVRWQGPDGSTVRTVPRYTFMDYRLQLDTHPGVQNAGLTGDDFETWTVERTRQFSAQGARGGLERPLVTRLADPKPPESPFPGIVAAARAPGSRLVTVREYCQLPHENERSAEYTIDDIHSTIPWGLAGEQLHRKQAAAESALLVAERLDAVLEVTDLSGHQEQLAAAWKRLLRAQHHDLHLCSPWHSARHGVSMGELGCRFAEQGKKEAQAVTRVALDALAGRFRADDSEGRPFLLFNPSPWSRRELVELPSSGKPIEVWLHGTRLQTQASCGIDGQPTVSFVVDLPPLGADTVHLRPGTHEAAAESGPGAFASSADLIAEESHGALADAGYLTVLRDGHVQRSTLDRVSLVEEGSVFRRYRLEGRLVDLPFVQWITVIPELRRIRLTTQIDFGGGQHPGPQLGDHRPDHAYYIQDDRKLCLNVESPFSRVFCDSPFLLVKPADPRVTAVNLLGLERPDEGGVAILHDGTPGWHVDRGAGVVRNVLAWGPERWLYASDDSITPGRSRYTAVRGVHRYEHELALAESRVDAVRSATDFRLPVLDVELRDGDGSMSAPWSFLRIEPETVVLTALFRQGGKTYARLWNSSSEPADVRLSGSVAGVVGVSLRLHEQRSCAWPTLRPWGVQTVRLDKPRGTV
jgi:hypothetical protein